MSKAVETIYNADKALVLYSPTTLSKMRTEELVPEIFVSPAKWQAISAKSGVSYDTLDFAGYNTYIGLGGGTVIDVAKFLATKHAAKCIAIPSMLSTDVFATDKVAAIYPEGKVTKLAKVPDEVIYDEELLLLSKKENLYGLVDVFSICTALEDWMIAYVDKKDDIDTDIYGKAAMILADARELSRYVYHSHNNEAECTKKIFDIVKRAGEITNEYGNGRPESGSEHIIAKNIEALVKVPHALAVTCGIAVVSLLHRNYSRATRELRQLGMFQEVLKSPITPEILTQAISNSKPRDDRYTVIDRYESTLESQAPALVEGTQIW